MPHTIDITVDSGAAEVVAPPTFAADYTTKPSAGSKNSTKYRTASGNMIANQGEKRVKTMTAGGDTRTMTFQVADVTKPLAPAGRITSKGHRIVLDDDKAYIQHETTGRKIQLHKKGNVFVMGMTIMPPTGEGANDGRDNARVLGDGGFTRQEED